jgi:hypothetical protein
MFVLEDVGVDAGALLAGADELLPHAVQESTITAAKTALKSFFFILSPFLDNYTL